MTRNMQKDEHESPSRLALTGVSVGGCAVRVVARDSSNRSVGTADLTVEGEQFH